MTGPDDPRTNSVRAHFVTQQTIIRFVRRHAPELRRSQRATVSNGIVTDGSGRRPADAPEPDEAPVPAGVPAPTDPDPSGTVPIKLPDPSGTAPIKPPDPPGTAPVKPSPEPRASAAAPPPATQPTSDRASGSAPVQSRGTARPGPGVLRPTGVAPVTGQVRPTGFSPVTTQATYTGAGPAKPAGVRAAVPSDIEPTTGAPAGTLPSRAPLASPAAGPDGAAPAAPATGEDDDDAFWLPIEEVNWDGSPVRPEPSPSERLLAWWRQRLERRRARPARLPRHPAAGLAGLVPLALLAGFLAWTSAEPLWLATGRGQAGVATVTRCTGHGLTLHCRGDFTATGRRFTARNVTLAWVPAADRSRGSRLEARMLRPGSGKAYVEAGTLTWHLRWLLSLVLALLCGPAIVWITGATRLPGDRARRGAVLLGLAGPVALTAGFLLVAF